MTKANTPPEADFSKDPDFDGELPHPATVVERRAGDDEVEDPDAAGEVLEETPATETPERGPDGKFLPAKKGKEKKDDKAKEVEETPEAKALREKEAENTKRFATLEVAKREQLKVSRARQDLEQREATFQSQLENVNRQIAAKDAELKQREAKVAKVEAVLANPTFEGLQEIGLDYSGWTRQAIDANTPEAQARRIARAEVERSRQEDRERQEKEARARQEQEVHAANRHDATTLVAMVERDADTYPDLYVYPEQEIAEAGIAVRDQLTKQNGGRPPTYGEVLGELQKRAKALEEQKQARLTKRQSGASSEAGRTAPNGTDPQASNGRPGKPSLTSATSGQRPSPHREMTEEEKDEWALGQLRGLRVAR